MAARCTSPRTWSAPPSSETPRNCARATPTGEGTAQFRSSGQNGPRQARHPNARGAGLPNISARPAEVDDRLEVGHWEIDQIIGARNQSSLITFAERVTRYTFAITMPCGYDALATLAGLTEGLDRIPTGMLRSVTFDQGSEWAEWETIAAIWGIDVWFCDPHSPWQRRPTLGPWPWDRAVRPAASCMRGRFVLDVPCSPSRRSASVSMFTWVIGATWGVAPGQT